MKRFIAAVVALGIAFAFAQSSSAQTETANPDLFVIPQRSTTAGGMVVVLRSSASTCTGPVTSAGFVAPIEFTHQNADGSWIGFGEVVDTPGSYAAGATCGGRLVDRTFTADAAR
ncbi:hypothetical protein [Lentzea kentuckyensis]|uniref:hypothetical protein n=1 Tax=Lentzea kentuckyensis TaxID=360086 RepID=UPI00117B4994|nr:hypothetical protein [Lentzea kentuckyensis]